jgi:hypothetical protein
MPDLEAAIVVVAVVVAPSQSSYPAHAVSAAGTIHPPPAAPDSPYPTARTMAPPYLPSTRIAPCDVGPE